MYFLICLLLFWCRYRRCDCFFFNKLFLFSFFYSWTCFWCWWLSTLRIYFPSRTWQNQWRKIEWNATPREYMPMKGGRGVIDDTPNNNYKMEKKDQTGQIGKCERKSHRKRHIHTYSLDWQSHKVIWVLFISK